MRTKGSPSRQPPPCVSAESIISLCYQEVGVALARTLISTGIRTEPYGPFYWRHVSCFCWFFSPGLKVLAQTFPEGMTTGTFPASCWASPPTSRRKRSAAPRPPPPPQKPAAAETRCWFREDELVKIHEQLEKLLPYSNSSKTISVRKEPDLSTCVCVCCRMFSPVFSCFMACDPHLSHQLDVQLSDFGEAQSSEDTLEIRCQSKPGWRHCLLHWLEWTPTGTRPYFGFFPL